MNFRWTSQIFPFIEIGGGNYYEIETWTPHGNDLLVLKDPGFFIGIGSKFMYGKS